MTLAALALALLAAPPPGAAAAPVHVAAAADLQAAFAEAGAAFTAEGGPPVAFSFAASGVLARQLAQGAPFDAFAAANEAFVDDAVRAAACDGATKARYAQGHLAVWTRGHGPAPSIADLAHARFRHVAIANPETAPYGAAAREALGRAGVWDALAPRVVYGESVRQALQLAETGNADAAIVAVSLAVASKGAWVPVDARLHAPLAQTAVACTRGKNAAGGVAFVRWLRTPKARAILARFGLTP